MKKAKGKRKETYEKQFSVGTNPTFWNKNGGIRFEDEVLKENLYPIEAYRLFQKKKKVFFSWKQKLKKAGEKFEKGKRAGEVIKRKFLFSFNFIVLL